MAGLGWGTIEAIIVHSIPVISLLLLPPDSEGLLTLDGIEFILLFGGYERIIAEAFHLSMMILTFYGIKNKLKVEQSKPIHTNFFTRDPKPVWLWLLIVAGIHFAFDFIFVVLVYLVDLITLYLLMTGIVGILTIYTIRRMEYYPLFPQYRFDEDQ